MKDKKMFKRIFSYMRPHLLSYIIALLLTGIVVVCDIFNPIIIGKSLAEIGKEAINFNKVIVLFVIGILIAIVKIIIPHTVHSRFLISILLPMIIFAELCLQD